MNCTMIESDEWIECLNWLVDCTTTVVYNMDVF
jgi:hypothetical protein